MYLLGRDCELTMSVKNYFLLFFFISFRHALITGSCAVEPKTDAADVAVWTIIGIFMAVVGTLLLISLCLAFRSW